MAGRYFGGKGEKSMSKMLLLFPEDEYNTLVDCFFGFGNISRLSACEMQGVSVEAFEKEKALFTLHNVIKNKELLSVFLEKIQSVENSKEYFDKARDIVSNYNSENKEYEPVDVALSTLVTIRFSRDYKRNSWRNAFSYEGRGYSEKVKAQKKDELNAIVSKFYDFTPASLLELHDKWQKVNLHNEDCMLHMENYCSSETLYILDPPYLAPKRGIKKIAGDKKPRNAGYEEDMSIDEHEELISKIIDLSDRGAKCMVCSLFEVDEKGRLLNVVEDPYTKLLEKGFRMVAVEKKYATSAAYDVRDKAGNRIVAKKRPKVEVAYINYTDIIGSWANFKYWDYKNIYSKKYIM